MIKDIPIKKVVLKNNCPECFNNEGLNLTFKQKFIENSFYKSIARDVSYDIDCNICNTIIYPERWTDDIERVFNYQQKAFTPRPASYSLKRMSWVFIFISVLLIFSVILLFLLRA